MKIDHMVTAGVLAVLMTFTGGTTVSAQSPTAEQNLPVANGDRPDCPMGNRMMGAGSTGRASMMMNSCKGDRSSWMGKGYSMVRHMHFMQNGVPLPYRDKFSSLAVTSETVQEGGALYAQNCASCHGARGFGDGEAGLELNPPPANLVHMIRMPILNDPYLLWTVAEGGGPVGSDMPAFKDVLSEEDIWKVVAAMRAGFPSQQIDEPEADITQHQDGGVIIGLLSEADVRVRIEQWSVWYGNPDIKVGAITLKNKNTYIAEILSQDNSVLQRLEIDRRTGWMQPAN